MKPSSPILALRPLIFALLVVLIPKQLNAQGTVFDSNLGPSAGSIPIDGSVWLGQQFQTGNNPGGYVLDSIQVQMAAASGTPSGFTLSFFSALNGVPSQYLGVLTGSANPATADLYSYDASALNLTLAPSCDYFVVESAANPSSQGSYEWDAAAHDTGGEDGWQDLSLAFSNDQGNDWTRTGRTAYEMAITATAIPEPSTWVLCLLGGGVFAIAPKRKANWLRP